MSESKGTEPAAKKFRSKGGRPLKSGVHRSRKSLTIPDPLLQRCEARAERMGVSFNDLVLAYMLMGEDLPVPADIELALKSQAKAEAQDSLLEEAS